jgi:flagellar P-ring protein precursor FlgI
MKFMQRPGYLLLSAVAILLAIPSPARAQYLRIRDICRVKGQEENTLHGMGLVVGLKGTGDTDGPTLRALGKMMELMGKPVAQPTGSAPEFDELKNARNVAMVYVTATIPRNGARQGEQLRCTVNAISAKSLEGGHLLMTPLVGPRPGQPRVYAIAQGAITLDPVNAPTSGTVHDGCRLEEDFSYSFADEQSNITLVIDSNRAGFPTAYEIEDAINRTQSGGTQSGGMDRPGDPWGEIAQAIDPVNVRVRIPAEYEKHRVHFIAILLDTQVPIQPNDARVVVNERSGVIVVGEKVMVGRVAVTHKNLSIQTGNDPITGPLFEIDSTAETSTSTTRLKALVHALNALKANSNDVIDIIKSLERSGDLYGRLIVE